MRKVRRALARKGAKCDGARLRTLLPPGGALAATRLCPGLRERAGASYG
jgi:hypothetical protein